MATSLGELCEALAGLMGEAQTGAPANERTVKTFGLPKLSLYEDDYFNDWNGRFRDGTHRDTSFVVTDFTQTGGKVEFGPSLATPVATSDLFYMLPDWTPEELIASINRAIDEAGALALESKVDETITLGSSTFEYVIPAAFAYIKDLYQESGTAGRYSQTSDRFDERHWSVLRGSQPRIQFNPTYVSLTTGRHLRIVGQGAQAKLVKDEDTTNVSVSYLLFQARAFLHFARIGELGDEHDKKAAAFQILADRARNNITVRPEGQKVAG
jgi:hypothetical protein